MASGGIDVNMIPESHKERISTIRHVFLSKYGRPPEFYARAPGRINLIGEHLDYCGYAVLPMAIEQDIIMAVAVNADRTIRLFNTTDPDQMDTEDPGGAGLSLPGAPQATANYDCSTSDIVIDLSLPRWYHYILGGFQAVQDRCGIRESVGLDIVIHGTIPQRAGLASSSALVSCAVLAAAHANGKDMSKEELVYVSLQGEHFMGTEDGPMDQAICFMAEPGKAKLISFNPLQTQDLTLPEDAVFVLAHSNEEIHKAGTAQYNTRVTECRLAAMVVAKRRGLHWRYIRTLHDLQCAVKGTLEDMAKLIHDHLHPEPFNRKEICDILGCDEVDLAPYLGPGTETVSSFKLYDRALHVIKEAARVWEFKRICDEGPDDVLAKLGNLMNASHSSCKQLFECSTPELDRLCHTFTKLHFFPGARLTGAGWGGFVIALSPKARVNSVVMQLIKQLHYSHLPEEIVNKRLFVTKPGAPASIYLEDENI